MRPKAFALVSLCLTIAACPGWGSKKKIVPEAPLPDAIRNAKTAFITNGGGNGSPLAFDEFYSDMKQWGRFQAAPSPDQADVIIQLRYVIEDKGQHVGTAYNSYTGQTSVYTRDVTDPQLVLSIFDARTNALLWSTTDHRRLARFEKNREKETINSADRLVDDLKSRIAATD
jgi:hypothetical protein